MRREFGAVLFLASVIGGAAIIVALGAGPFGGQPPAPDEGTEIKFRDAAEEAGLAYGSTRRYSGMRAVMGQAGVYALDYDDDGWTDLLALGATAPGLFHNANGSFERSGALPEDVEPARAATLLDFDRDGREDLVLFGLGEPPRLYRNVGGTFERRSVGFEQPLAAPMGAVTADFDGDGCLDLFVYQNGDWTERLPRGYYNESVPIEGDNGNPNYVYWGDCATFERGTATASGIETWTLAASAVDLDGDGDADVHVANDFQRDFVLVNDGDREFSRRLLGPATDRNAMSSEIGDLNGDRRPDIIVTNIHYPAMLKETVNNSMRTRSEGNNILVNTGDGSFVDRGQTYGGIEGGWGWAASLADFDNDGDRDLFHTTRWLNFRGLGMGFDESELDAMYHRHPSLEYPAVWRWANGSFRSLDPASVGLSRTDGRGAVALDYDHDGDLDIAIANEVGPFRLLENVGATRTAIELSLVGADGGPALSATVDVTADGVTRFRRLTDRSDYFSQEPRTLHIGMNGADRATVTVRWPDGETLTLTDVRTGYRYVIGPQGIERSQRLS